MINNIKLRGVLVVSRYGAVRLLLEDTTHKSHTLKEIRLPQRESDRWNLQNLFIFTFYILLRMSDAYVDE